MPNPLPPPGQNEGALRQRFLAQSLWGAVFAALGLGIYRLFDIPLLGWIDLSVALLCIGLYVLLRNAERLHRAQSAQQGTALATPWEAVPHYDVLTGLPNRALLADRMRQTLARARREHGLVAVCHLDLDGFKAINDTYGHDIGDRVLVEITRRICAAIREDDTAARLGGDEFVLLLAALQAPEECVSSLHRLLQGIVQPILLDGHTLTVTASIGVALYPEDEQEAATLLRHAEQAMYVAKQAGGNRYHLFDPEHDQRVRLHHTLLQEVHAGLQRGEFELYYQPQVALATRRMTGVEALIRWNHPQRGLLGPAQFLRAIEDTELERVLDDWVLTHAFTQLRAWRETGQSFTLSINVSARQLQMPGFAAHLRQLMGACCPQPCLDCLKLEILESTVLEDFDRIGTFIRACRDIGIGFALDDFGTGYSSFTYLSRLDVDVLKIDQSFVRDMLQQPGERAIVQGIVALAQAFGRGVIAEGVETEAQWQALREMGCAVGQGDGIAPPMPAHALLAWRDRFEQAGAGGR
ncbi:MAG: hypothetical protein Fur0040_10750 [Sideroxydans sp.]